MLGGSDKTTESFLQISNFPGSVLGGCWKGSLHPHMAGADDEKIKLVEMIWCWFDYNDDGDFDLIITTMMTMMIWL